MEKCIFCEIAGKRLPSDVVHEDREFMAFLDINPLTKGHVLVIPKSHERWVYDVGNFGEYFEFTKRIIRAQIESLNPNYVNIITAGLGVPHAHIHLIPRYDNDGHPEIPTSERKLKLSDEELKEIMEKIKGCIHSDAKDEPKEKEETEPKKESISLDEDELMFIRREAESG